MVKAHGEDIQQDLLKVLIGQAIEVVAVHRRRLTKQIGDAVVGNVVLSLYQVTQRQLRWCPKAKSNGGRKSKTLRVGLVAICEILTVCEQIDSYSHRLGKRLVDIGSTPVELPS